MSFYWIMLAAVLMLMYASQRKRLRRQTRELRNQTSRLDEFSSENLRLQRQSDRAADRLTKSVPGPVDRKEGEAPDE